MPNTFGSTGGGWPLVDPRCVREHRERFRRDMFPELDRANSYYCASGIWPDSGWILLDRYSYNQINRYSTNLVLNIQDFFNPPITINNLAIVQARCVTRGGANDPNAIYLVQVTSGEGVIYNQWYQQAVTIQYNVRAPAYDTQYYSYSMNGAVPWTWSTMIGDLWNRASNQLGPYPGLPSAPLGTPENFIFPGVSLWEAITQILNYLGMTVVGNYPSLSIAISGATDTAFTTLQTGYAGYLEDDMEYIDGGSGRVPGQVVVYFHRRNQYYGTEETIRRDIYQWQAATAYGVTVTAPAPFNASAGIAHLWDSFTVRADANGEALAADVATATSIAAERVTQFFNNIFSGTLGAMRQVYIGALPFVTGSQCDGVRWFNTGYMGNGKYDDYGGWRTEIIRGYMWPEVQFPTTKPPAAGLM